MVLRVLLGDISTGHFCQILCLQTSSLIFRIWRVKIIVAIERKHILGVNAFFDLPVWHFRILLVLRYRIDQLFYATFHISRLIDYFLGVSQNCRCLHFKHLFALFFCQLLRIIDLLILNFEQTISTNIVTMHIYSLCFCWMHIIHLDNYVTL